jgi:hypothetical protein
VIGPTGYMEGFYVELLASDGVCEAFRLKLSARSVDIIRAMIFRFFHGVGCAHYSISVIQYLRVAYSVQLQTSHYSRSLVC